MKRYIAKRLAWTLVATFFALSIVFGILTLSPNTGQMEASFHAAQEGGNPDEAMEAYRERKGLNEPVSERYTDYMTNIATLNWGWSTTRNQPVTTALATAWPYSAQIMIPAILLAVTIGFGLGLYSAMHQYTSIDYFATFIAFFGISIPNFWFAIVLILVVSVWMKDLVVFGVPLEPYVPPVYYHTGVEFVSLKNLQQITLPVIVTSTAAVAGQMRYSRSQALEYAESQFVKAARAKGAGEWHLLIKHILRVALIPLSTILVSDALALLWAGATLVEIVFQIPGIGLLGYKAIINQDTALIMGVTLIPVFLALIGNLLQDLAYVWLDPRIDYGDRT
ncbi:ABC transporter permease [Haladaptatus cibarius]|uniref:ABC transporter permease n=1 Tax=Haladaptatus cibarius TaxID=453847 RepID=UPI00067932B8|nr:ABC transporter permease [Haladaptatus cibarius]